MKSPQLYSIRKFTLKQIIKNNNHLQLSPNEQRYYEIKQSDNMLFRQVRLITNDFSERNKYIVFVDCNGWKSNEKELCEILRNGFYINNKLFIPTEKSASMSRNSVVGFVDATIEPELNRRITMDMKFEKTVLAKLLAYRGLFFSGCFCLEDWYPYIVVVDDYTKVIPNQHIKYLVDIEKEWIDKEGNPRIWKEKGVEEGYKDVEITLWDGSGIHSPQVTQFVKSQIECEENPTSILWRLPYMKGMTHEVDFKLWFKEHGLFTVDDIFGNQHFIDDVDIIVTKSFYKGYKYFNKDWDLYWEKFKKYNHCVGVATWNYSFENEPKTTKSSYQILQDLDLEFEDFIQLADYSKKWIEKIVSGDLIYTYCFLGLFADHVKPSNNYMKAILKNPEMLKEEGVRKYLIDLLVKNIDLMKCGKLYLDGAFRFVVTDLIAFLEYISGMEPVGILKSNEFYSKDINGVCLGERVIERNPHIANSEHLILKGIDDPLLEKYCGRLANVCQVNGHSLSLPRLNGGDEDGDKLFVIDNEIIKSGIHRDLPIIIDMEDKVTILEEEINQDNIVNCIIRSMISLVGEISNYATCYHNKSPQRTDKQKERHLEYINILSVCAGKSIDYAKTGIIFHVPRHIAKYAKPLPYFMKYVGDYYRKIKRFNKAQSNMNRLAWDIEKWHKEIRFKRKYKDFDYSIMIDENIPLNQDKMNKLEEIYLDFLKKMKELGKQNALSKNYDEYKDYFGDDVSKEEVMNTKINWNYYYDQYRMMAEKICHNKKELANLAVKLCYEKHPKKNKKFMWIVAGEGIVENIKQVDIMLPIEDRNGEYEYLGNTYKLQEVNIIAE